MLNNRDIAERIRRYDFHPSAVRPRLLFDAATVPALQSRAKARPGCLESVRERAAVAVARGAGDVNVLEAYLDSQAAVDVAAARLLTGDGSHDVWLRERIDTLLAMESWFCHVHVGVCRVCDHVMCNLAAHVALVQDWASDLFDEDDTRRIADSLRRLHLVPFLDATTAGQFEWWFRPELANNWKIMCCGESGLALCGLVGHFPEAREAMARAAQGVLEVLDQVPPEGDWGEGPGYWFHTLWMGLRFARALRRLSDGAIDLFEHPALKVTGDFVTQLTTPAAQVFNFGDCDPALSAVMSEALAMLAAEQDRADWRYVARLAPSSTPLFLAVDDPSAASAPSTRRAAAFPTSGAATLRTGWGANDLFLGFRTGPSDVGHAHLDANSFVLEAGGQTLVLENPYWPQGHFLGFFDMSGGGRWNFDGPGTVGHSTLLVDGQGQTWGPEYGAHLLYAEDRGASLVAAGDAAPAYPGLLRRFTRTFLMLPPDRLVIRDVIECEGERHVEWLLHYAGDIEDRGVASMIENNGVGLSVVPLLPDRDNGWRWSDVTRTSLYRHSDSLNMVTPRIRYRGFAAFRKADSFEFLFGLKINGDGEADWCFTAGEKGEWRLESVDGNGVVVPDGEGLRLV